MTTPNPQNPPEINLTEGIVKKGGVNLKQTVRRPGPPAGQGVKGKHFVPGEGWIEDGSALKAPEKRREVSIVISSADGDTVKVVVNGIDEETGQKLTRVCVCPDSDTAVGHILEDLEDFGFAIDKETITKIQRPTE